MHLNIGEKMDETSEKLKDFSEPQAEITFSIPQYSDKETNQPWTRTLKLNYKYVYRVFKRELENIQRRKEKVESSKGEQKDG